MAQAAGAALLNLGAHGVVANPGNIQELLADGVLNGGLHALDAGGHALFAEDIDNVLVRNDVPICNVFGNRIDLTPAQALQFLCDNTNHVFVHSANDKICQNMNVPDRAELAYKVACIRLICLKKGYISSGFALDHEAYTNVIRGDDAIPANQAAVPPQAAVPANDNFVNVPQNVIDWVEVRATRTDAGSRVKDLMGAMTTLISMTAYMFRARGHHFIDTGGFEEKYQALLTGAGLPAECLGMVPPAKAYARWGLHAIFPRHLDQLWQAYVHDGQCPGNMAKRINCAAAGQAAYYAVYAGVQDLQAAAPRFLDKLGTQVENLTDTIEVLRQDRWKGSTIQHFYPGNRNRDGIMPEADLSVMASAVFSIYKSIDPNATLLNAKSLERVCQGAVATGFVAGKLFIHAVKDMKGHMQIGATLEEMAVAADVNKNA